MAKIDIISGFLGAGKTTLIQKLLKEALTGEQVMLIENEFGEIGIDGGFLKEAGIQITEMNSGCICCSLVGDFETALTEAMETYAPDRIIIEPSGVGKLSDVMAAVYKVSEKTGASLNSATVVVDAAKAKMYHKNFGEFYNDQIAHAKTIILSRTDKMSEEKIETVAALLRELNDKAVIITTPWSRLAGERILSAMEKEDDLLAELLKEANEHHAREEEEHEHHHHHHEEEEEHEHRHHHGDEDGHCHCHEHHHHADDVFTSWGKETVRSYAREELEEMLRKLDDAETYGTILRAKGMVAEKNTDNWLYFDYTPGDVDVRYGGADITGKLCVIGARISEKAVEELFLGK